MLELELDKPAPSPESLEIKKKDSDEVIDRKLKAQEKEYEKCALSFKYFAENYVKITHPKKGLVPFCLYKYQERVIHDYETYKHNIIRKFRQGGLTTLTVIWALWRCMFKLDQKIMVLSKSDREAKGAGKIVSNVVKYLPEWLNANIELDNQHEKVFGDTNGTIEFWTCEAARSKSLTYLIIDEAAFIKNMDEHWKSMYPTLATGGSCIVISTVHGMGNWYEQTYHDAEAGKNEFHVIDLHYSENPDYNNPAWVREMKANLGERGWKQEIEGSFLSSGDTFVPGEIIKEIEEFTRYNHPIRKMFKEWEGEGINADYLMLNDKYERGALWVWKDPEVDYEYIIAVDPAEGVGGGADFSAFHIVKLPRSPMERMEQVAEFYSDIVPSDMFAQIIYTVGKWYNEALVIVEALGPSGGSVMNRLENQLCYDNLYYETKGNSERAGVRTDRQSRPIFLEALRVDLMNRELIINSDRFAKELKTFIYNKVKRRPEAQSGRHDDLIMAMAILLGVSQNFTRNIPVGANTLMNEKDVTKTTSFLKIRAEIEGGLVEDLLAQMEEEEREGSNADSDASLVKNVLFDDHRDQWKEYWNKNKWLLG